MVVTRKKAHKKGKNRTAVKRGGGWFSFGKTEEETPEQKKIREFMETYDPEQEKKDAAERKLKEQQEAAEKKQREMIHFKNLMEAIQKEDEAKVKEILNNKPNINMTDENRLAPLHHAVIRGNRTIVRLLIDYIVKSKSNSYTYGTPSMAIDIVDNQSRTPLMLAYLYKHYDIAQMLIHGGANINTRDLNHDNLIMKMIKLVTEDSDISVTAEMIEKMREDGANPYMENKKGFSVIGYLNWISPRSLSKEQIKLLGQIRIALQDIYTLDGARGIRSWGGSRKKKRSTRRMTRRLLS